MRFLLDQGLPRSAVGLLREAGHKADHVGDLGMARADDESILARAVADSSVVVTLDSDFHTLLALSGERQPSVIRIRRQRMKADALCDLIRQVIEAVADELAHGAAVTVNERSIRARLLPIAPAPGSPGTSGS